MAMLFLLGVAGGMMLCIRGRVQTGQTQLTGVAERLAIWDRLHEVEERLKALEERTSQEGRP